MKKVEIKKLLIFIEKCAPKMPSKSSLYTEGIFPLSKIPLLEP